MREKSVNKDLKTSRMTDCEHLFSERIKGRRIGTKILNIFHDGALMISRQK
jgi:hypothetical protein